MHRILSLFLAIVLLAGSMNPVRGQIMWPGDINDNGVVNAVDLLYLGIAYGAMGPVRSGATPDWTPQMITALWAEDFPDGINYAFADCDGNGIVDDDDLDDAIGDNFGLTHGTLLPDGYANADPGTAPQIELVPNATLVEEGALVNIDLLLGTDAFPVSDFYGLALTFSYTTGLLNDDDGLELQSEANSWINPDASLLLEIQQTEEDTGAGQYSVTRTNQQTVGSGSGKIASFSIVVEDIIVGLTVDTFRLRIDSVLMVDKELNVLPLVPASVEIIIARDTSTVTTATIAPARPIEWSVYPNPGAGSFNVSCGRPIDAFRLVDTRGRPAPHRLARLSESHYRLEAGELPAGLYFLRIQVDDRLLSKRIFISPNNN